MRTFFAIPYKQSHFRNIEKQQQIQARKELYDVPALVLLAILTIAVSIKMTLMIALS